MSAPVSTAVLKELPSCSRPSGESMTPRIPSSARLLDKSAEMLHATNNGLLCCQSTPEVASMSSVWVSDQDIAELISDIRCTVIVMRDLRKFP